MADPLPSPPSYTTEFVIIDEAHERTIPTDLLLALLKGTLPLLSDLKVGFEDGFSKGPSTWPQLRTPEAPRCSNLLGSSSPPRPKSLQSQSSLSSEETAWPSSMSLATVVEGIRPPTFVPLATAVVLIC
ncbi:hypothetical protein FOXYSP1_13562 [Fusarium oxysporum f. sp. phaseoli]